MKMQRHHRALPQARIRHVRLLIAGVQSLMLEALRSCLDAEPEITVVGLVDAARETKPSPALADPDVVLLDTAPLMDGAQMARRLLSAFPKARLIALNSSADRAAIIGVLRAGAHGCLLKDCSPTELVRGIHAVHAGEPFFSPAVTRLIEHEFVRELNAPPQQLHAVALKPNERRLLQLIADGRSNKEMAVHLAMSVRTVEKYRESLVAKLGIRTVAGLTKFAIRHGLSTLE